MSRRQPFEPSWLQVVQAALIGLGPLAFSLACSLGWTPTNRALGALLGWIGATVGHNWMMLTERRERE